MRLDKILSSLILLFVIVVLVAIRSVTLPGASQGLEFLFKPDFSKVTANTFLDALSLFKAF